MRIIVTGAAGLLGSWISRELVRAGHDVLGLDDLSGGSLENVRGWAPPGRFVRVDLRRPEVVRRIFEDFRPELVHHLAAHPHEGLSQFSPLDVFSTNALAALVVFEEAARTGVGRVVFYSSMARYGAGIPPFSEESPTAPVDVYGSAKLAAEQSLRALSEAHGFDWTIVVPHNVGGVGQARDDPARNVLAIWINQCLRGKDIFIYGDGQQVRAFSDIRDSVGCYVLAGFSGGASRQIINVGGGRPIMLNEAADLVLSHFPERQKVHIDPRPCEVYLAWCTTDKSTRLLGFEDRYSPADLVESMVVWMREVGPREPIYPVLELAENAPRTWRDRLI